MLSTVAAYAAVAEREWQASSAWDITAHSLSDAATVLHAAFDQTVVARAGQTSARLGCLRSILC